MKRETRKSSAEKIILVVEMEQRMDMKKT